MYFYNLLQNNKIYLDLKLNGAFILDPYLKRTKYEQKSSVHFNVPSQLRSAESSRIRIIQSLSRQLGLYLNIKLINSTLDQLKNLYLN